MSKVWLITGSGNGLGRDIAEAALAAGESVVDVVSRLKMLCRVLVWPRFLLSAGLSGSCISSSKRLPPHTPNGLYTGIVIIKSTVLIPVADPLL